MCVTLVLTKNTWATFVEGVSGVPIAPKERTHAPRALVGKISKDSALKIAEAP